MWTKNRIALGHWLEWFSYTPTYSSYHVYSRLLWPNQFFPISIFILFIFLAGAFTCLYYVCSNHLKWCFFIFLTIKTIFVFTQTSFPYIFLILSNIQYSICIFMTLMLSFLCFSMGQNSVPYIRIDLMEVLWNLLFIRVCILRTGDTHVPLDCFTSTTLSWSYD